MKNQAVEEPAIFCAFCPKSAWKNGIADTLK
jgi:hypothetical protein